MKYGVLTDIHANREAFEAVLADATLREVDRIVMLGDIVGYGPDPEWCADKAAELVGKGALCVRGNHDSAASGTPESMRSSARRAIDWTQTRLSPDQQRFLAQLPLIIEEGDLLFVHASVNAPADWSYVTSETQAIAAFRSCKARVILCGHVHVPFLASCDLNGVVREQTFPSGLPIPLIRSRRWLVVVGAVGQPRDGIPQAGYAVLDTNTNDITFRRVPYDTAQTVKKLRAAGLPEDLALRLIRGS